ncbi:hypothetical protein [Thiothrix sp.]|jgi:hypothetical protein|uniref:hypothetical protein n=1 Tax=Thiothrix sp. TaxID=1032 RepID=UPI00257FB868|nr:hypothetical protein [Thiothrix sp.]
MKRLALIFILSFPHVVLSDSDPYQEGYISGARIKAFDDGWRDAQAQSAQPSPASKDEIIKRLGEVHEITLAPESGVRIDYMSKDRSFKKQDDGLSSGVKITWSDNQPMAIINIGKGLKERAEEYRAVILQRTKNMVVFAVMYDTPIPISKSEIYTIYPKENIGFLTISSSYVGSEWVEIAAQSDASIPASTSVTFPLKGI